MLGYYPQLCCLFTYVSNNRNYVISFAHASQPSTVANQRNAKLERMDNRVTHK